MGEPGDTCGPYCGRLAAREPASVPVLDPRHLYWGLLERLYNPAGNTQIVNVYFRGGELDARTCVSAAHIFLLISRFPGEYARIMEALGSPAESFPIVRAYTPEAYARKRAWLSGAFRFEEAGTNTLRIWIHLDPDARARAVAEQEGRRFRDYDFGVRGRKNSRLLGDVLIQSALTNYALRGRYDSAADRHRDTGARGLPPPDVSEGHRALHEDILSGPTPAFRAGTGLVFTDTTPEAAIRAAESAWTGGHYLERPIAVDIDHN
jgi:hypothetical protein